jgi:hypothetical protein
VTSAENVDIVIMWVDGSDPQWRRKKSRHRPDSRRCLITADVEGRYRCNEELRFLLRSIARYWTLPGRIHLVTDQQAPGFLRHHPRLSIVDHREIMPASHLPSFSSRAIEANLHRIPGLAEHYVVFNDDIFLTRAAGRSDFFGNRGAMVYLSDVLLPACAGIQTFAGQGGGVNARNWIARRYGTSHVDHVIEHYPKGIRKSWMRELEAEDAAIFAETSQARFRQAGTQSILANLYGHWCLARGRGEIRRNECVYLDSHDVENDELHSLSSLVHGKLCLCINDTTDNRNDVGALHKKTSRLLAELFPDPSPYERSDCESCLHAPVSGKKCGRHRTGKPAPRSHHVGNDIAVPA